MLGGGHQLHRPESREVPGQAAPLVVLVFVALIGGTTTFAVLNGQDEEKARAAEIEKANEEVEAEEASRPEQSATKRASRAEPQAGRQRRRSSGPGGTLQLEASPTDIAFDTTELSSEPGEVTIDFDNPRRSNTTSRSNRTAKRSPTPN